MRCSEGGLRSPSSLQFGLQCQADPCRTRGMTTRDDDAVYVDVCTMQVMSRKMRRLTRTVDEKLRCGYRRNRRRSEVAGASSATKTLRRRAGRYINRHTSGTRARRRHRQPYLRQSCAAYVRLVRTSRSRCHVAVKGGAPGPRCIVCGEYN